jgi:murein DD-endopeptidase MepM/ murein hydrolase activator NlpD
MIERLLALAIGAVLGAVLLLPLGAYAVLSGNASRECTPVPDTLFAADSATQKSAGLDREQYTNATAIVRTGAELGVPVRGWIIAVAVALQESSLRVVDHGDSAGPDSRGLFQQRAPWGPEPERMDPMASARLFYTGGHGGQAGLLDIPGWPELPLTEAAHAVQRNADPDAYADREQHATAVVTALITGPSSTGVPGPPDTPTAVPIESSAPQKDSTPATVSTGASPASLGCPATGSGLPAANGAWIAPVDAPISSRFRTSERPDHDGLDLAAARGTPVRAAAAGTVTRIHCSVTPATHGCDRDGSLAVGGCGWFIELRHSGGITTRYCHLQTRPDLPIGAAVSGGQAIAHVGASGHVTGPHLHLEIRETIGGKTALVDPERFLLGQGVRLP